MAEERTERQVTTMNLHQKLATIRKQVHNIEKGGHNAFHDYDYVAGADVQGIIGTRLAELNITIGRRNLVITKHIIQSSKGPKTVTGAQLQYGFLDGDSREEKWDDAYGEGEDASDKGSFKAQTGALKYHLIQTFCLAMGDDPEKDDKNDSESSADKNSTAGVARGGEAQSPKVNPSAPILPLRGRPCPKCGVVGHLMKGKEEYGGGWLCYKKNGGCGARFQEEPGLVVVKPPDTKATFTADHREALKRAATERMGTIEGPKWLSLRLRELGCQRWTDMTLDQFKGLMTQIADVAAPSQDPDMDLDIAFGEEEQTAIQKDLRDHETR